MLKNQGNLSPAVTARQNSFSPNGAKRNWLIREKFALPVVRTFSLQTELRKAWIWVPGTLFAAAIVSIDVGQGKVGLTLACNVCCPDREAGGWMVTRMRSPHNTRQLFLTADADIVSNGLDIVIPR
jgi:hypothetical protein